MAHRALSERAHGESDWGVDAGRALRRGIVVVVACTGIPFIGFAWSTASGNGSPSTIDFTLLYLLVISFGVGGFLAQLHGDPGFPWIGAVASFSVYVVLVLVGALVTALATHESWVDSMDGYGFLVIPLTLLGWAGSVAGERIRRSRN